MEVIGNQNCLKIFLKISYFEFLRWKTVIQDAKTWERVNGESTIHKKTGQIVNNIVITWWENYKHILKTKNKIVRVFVCWYIFWMSQHGSVCNLQHSFFIKQRLVGHMLRQMLSSSKGDKHSMQDASRFVLWVWLHEYTNSVLWLHPDAIYLW